MRGVALLLTARRARHADPIALRVYELLGFVELVYSKWQTCVCPSRNSWFTSRQATGTGTSTCPLTVIPGRMYGALAMGQRAWGYNGAVEQLSQVDAQQVRWRRSDFWIRELGMCSIIL